ncbi:MAG: DUF2249 domain-containing protein [Gammaproteobacteria bacterium]|nr:DUF2249 domain-containing protein [Gammaproteobacteria bacterium]
MAEHVLDVSELEPPEPLVRTLEAAEALAPGDYLRMLHRRDPCLLPDNLRSRGFCFQQRPGVRTAVEVFIWREGDALGEQAARQACDGP